MILTYHEVVCNQCTSAIGHYPAGTKGVTNLQVIEDGGIVRGKKHFCNTECEEKYNESHTNTKQR